MVYKRFVGQGGILYTRVRVDVVINHTTAQEKIRLYPNPSDGFIQISGLTKNQKYTLYNIIGAKIKNGLISKNKKIDVRNLTNGLYFLKFKDGTTIKFLKE